MSEETQVGPVSKLAYWGGWIMSAPPVLLLLFGGCMKVAQTAMVVESFAKQGYPAKAPLLIGIAELTCTVIYLFPKTAILGAILLTGYLGGAVDSMAHEGDPLLVMPFTFGVLVWGGVFLRDARVRALIPFCK